MPNEVFVHVLPATQVLNLEIVEGLFTRSDFIIFHFEKFATWPFRQNTVYGKTSGEPVADWTFTIFNRRRILANFRMASSVPATPLDKGVGNQNPEDRYGMLVRKGMEDSTHVFSF